MEWTKLELRKAAVLRKEVDLAIRQVTAAVENDNQNLVDDLMESIQFRIDQIEEFYAQNDSDDRAILFEKQRLRLRRTLQNLAPPPPPPPGVTEGQSSPEREKTLNVTPTKKKNVDPLTRQQKYTLRSTSSGGSPVHAAFNSTVSSPLSPKKTPEKNNSRMHINELGDDESGISSLMTSNSKLKLKKKKKGAPIYSWEAEGEENQSDNNVHTAQERIFTAEHGSFIPTTTPGIYMAEESTDEGGSVTSEISENIHSEKSFSDYPSTHLDIQIVLTQAEFEAYVVRKRNVTKKTSDSKNAVLQAKTGNNNDSKFSNYLSKQSQFLVTQTPYMDPKRVKWDLCRPKQPDKWINPKGFL